MVKRSPPLVNVCSDKFAEWTKKPTKQNKATFYCVSRSRPVSHPAYVNVQNGKLVL